MGFPVHFHFKPIVLNFSIVSQLRLYQNCLYTMFEVQWYRAEYEKGKTYSYIYFIQLFVQSQSLSQVI